MNTKESLVLTIIIVVTILGIVTIWAYQDNREMEEVCKNPHPEMEELCKDFNN